MKKLIVASGGLLAVLILFIAYLFARRGELESLQMGSVQISVGDTLRSTGMQLERAMSSNDSKWTVIVDDQISDRKFGSPFASTNGLIVGQIANHFDCKFEINKQNKLIVFY